MLPTSPRPFRFLLYLEWVLLGIVALSELGKVSFFQLPRSPLLNLVCLGLFVLMGLKLPGRDRWLKLLYTALELALILVMSLIGGVRLMTLLYVVFVIRNCFIFVGATRTLISLTAFFLAMLTQFQRLSYWFPAVAMPERLGFIGLSIAVLFGLVLLFLQLLVNAILAERHSREQLAIANIQLREYALKVESIATLQERNRIAREIHDSLGHSLTAFNLHLEAALRLLKSDLNGAIALLQEAKQLGNQALEDVRDSVSTLRSEPLQGITLEDAVASLVADFQRSVGIKPSLTIQEKHTLPLDLKIAAYRIIQESLTNICKYAQATQVVIQLITTETSLELSIQDNGKGFDSAQTTTGFGLQGMRERAIALGGSFTLTTSPHTGCQIQVIFPLTSTVRHKFVYY